MKWSFILDSWCAVRRTCRACSAASERLLPCFCSVTAFPSRSSFLEPMLPTARVRQDFHLHNTTHSSFLSATIPLLSILSWSVYCVVCVLSILHHSFTPTLMCSPVWHLCVNQLREKSKGIFSSQFIFRIRKDTLRAFSIKDNFEESLTDRIGTNEDKHSNLIYYFTHQQSHVAWRG